MWALLIEPLRELLQWLLAALVTEAKRPVPGEVVEATPADVAHDLAARAAAGTFPGIKLPLLAIAALALGGCSVFDQRVIVARPAVPVILAEDLPDAVVLVKLSDGSWTRARANLYAGELVLSDPLDYPAELINGHASEIAGRQAVHAAK